MHKLPFALLLATSAVACVDQASTSGDTPSQVSSALDQANGGNTTADEAPMFDEQAAFDAMAIEDDAAVTDPMASDPAVANIIASPTVDSRRVLVLWGRMPGDPNATVGRDWSGSLQISRGALIVGRTVRFEPATDRLLPRLAPDTVSFQSVTRPFADGLLLRVVEPDAASTDPLTLDYTSANAQSPVSYSFDLAQLATGPIVIDAGDGFKMVAIALRDGDCHHGFMRGRWHELTPKMGVYRGIVADADGTPIGHVRGIYGERLSGEKVMFGKFIANDGKFLGVLAGTYDAGEFRARWIDRGGDHGKVHGHYFEATDLRGGGFVARWAETSCTQD